MSISCTNNEQTAEELTPAMITLVKAAAKLSARAHVTRHTHKFTTQFSEGSLSRRGVASVAPHPVEPQGFVQHMFCAVI